jgi:hypothetical protein
LQNLRTVYVFLSIRNRNHGASKHNLYYVSPNSGQSVRFVRYGKAMWSWCFKARAGTGHVPAEGVESMGVGGEKRETVLLRKILCERGDGPWAVSCLSDWPLASLSRTATCSRYAEDVGVTGGTAPRILNVDIKQRYAVSSSPGRFLLRRVFIRHEVRWSSQTFCKTRFGPLFQSLASLSPAVVTATPWLKAEGKRTGPSVRLSTEQNPPSEANKHGSGGQSSTSHCGTPGSTTNVDILTLGDFFRGRRVSPVSIFPPLPHKLL